VRFNRTQYGEYDVEATLPDGSTASYGRIEKNVFPADTGLNWVWRLDGTEMFGTRTLNEAKSLVRAEVLEMAGQ